MADQELVKGLGIRKIVTFDETDRERWMGICEEAISAIEPSQEQLFRITWNAMHSKELPLATRVQLYTRMGIPDYIQIKLLSGQAWIRENAHGNMEFYEDKPV